MIKNNTELLMQVCSSQSFVHLKPTDLIGSIFSEEAYKKKYQQ